MIRALVAAVWWTLYIPAAALIGFPWYFITRDVGFLYRVAMWGALAGVRLAGVKIEIVGLDRLDLSRCYIFMSNHTSNIDPPMLVPLIPRRTSVLVKKELFKIPILGYAMKVGDLVPVDRRNREAAIESVKAAERVLRNGLNMLVYAEGTRSWDGRLLPFKKGPFYLAIESGFPVVPITLVNTHDIWPKGKFRIRPLTAKIVFHEPIDPKQIGDREQLMVLVRSTIESALPEQYKGTSVEPTSVE